MNPEVTPVDILKVARAEIDTPEKWYQGGFTPALDDAEGMNDKSQPCCLEGAIIRATAALFGVVPTDAMYGRSENTELLQIRSDVFDAWRKHTSRSLNGFNDDPDTTHADVLSALDKAIEEESDHE